MGNNCCTRSGVMYDDDVQQVKKKSSADRSKVTQNSNNTTPQNNITPLQLSEAVDGNNANYTRTLMAALARTLLPLQQPDNDTYAQYPPPPYPRKRFQQVFNNCTFESCNVNSGLH